MLTYALVERSDLEYLRISDRPLQQLLTLHMYFAAAAAIPRILFYPIWRFIVLLSEWPPIVSWSLLLYSLESETGQPCFSYKSYMKTNCYNSMLNISKLLWDSCTPHVINRTNAIYCRGFISQVRENNRVRSFKTPARLLKCPLRAPAHILSITYSSTSS